MNSVLSSGVSNPNKRRFRWDTSSASNGRLKHLWKQCTMSLLDAFFKLVCLLRMFWYLGFVSVADSERLFTKYIKSLNNTPSLYWEWYILSIIPMSSLKLRMSRSSSLDWGIRAYGIICSIKIVNGIRLNIGDISIFSFIIHIQQYYLYSFTIYLTETLPRPYRDPTETLSRPYRDLIETLSRPYWDPTETLSRPYWDPTETLSRHDRKLIYQYPTETLSRPYRDPTETRPKTHISISHRDLIETLLRPYRGPTENSYINIPPITRYITHLPITIYEYIYWNHIERPGSETGGDRSVQRN